MTTTLTDAPVATLIDRLFDADQNSRPALGLARRAISDEDHDRLMRSRTDYRGFYAELKDMPLAVSPATGQLLYMLARSTGARSIVEFGTSFGISTIHLAAALRDNGGGLLITSEFEAGKIAHAKVNLTAAGLVDLVEFREGDALETLGRDLPDAIDLVLLDGAKGLYADILDRLESRLRPGAFIVADNADYCPDYLDRVRATGGGYLSVPFADDVELSMKL